MWWLHRIAKYLHKTIPELVQSTTATELVRWRQVILEEAREEVEREWKGRDKRDWYDATIIHELHLLRVQIARVFSPEVTTDKKVEDCLIPFVLKGEAPRPKTDEEKEAELAAVRERIEMRKMIGFAMTGFDPRTGKFATRKPPPQSP